MAGSLFQNEINRMCVAQLAIFGEPLTFDPAASGAYQIVGIWSEGEVARQRNQHAAAVVFAQLSSFVAYPLKGDLVIRGGVSYKIAEDTLDTQNLDGMGGIYLILRKV